MVKRTGPTNFELKELLAKLESSSQQSAFWRRIIKDLSRARRERRTVNLYKIEKYARDGETIIVPGKVLSVGEISKKVDVAALTFSTQAKKKIEQAQGKAISITQLFEQNPQAKNVRILG